MLFTRLADGLTALAVSLTEVNSMLMVVVSIMLLPVILWFPSLP